MHYKVLIFQWVNSKAETWLKKTPPPPSQFDPPIIRVKVNIEFKLKYSYFSIKFNQSILREK